LAAVDIGTPRKTAILPGAMASQAPLAALAVKLEPLAQPGGGPPGPATGQP
jgi:hypothetical protein